MREIVDFEGISLLPEWRQAVKSFLELDPKPGQIISKKWLMEQFNIPTRVAGTRDEFTADSLEFVRNWTQFRDTLLLDHLICLVSIGQGKYEYIHPKEQTDFALFTGEKQIVSAIEKMGMRASCVNLDQLGDSDRQRHADGLAKIAGIKLMNDRRKKLGRLAIEQG